MDRQRLSHVSQNSLVWKDIVLTAAHCGNDWSGSAIVSAFEYDTVTSRAERIGIRTRVIHPNFNSNTLRYDFQIVALKAFSTKVAVNKFSKPFNGVMTSGETLTVMGFGAINVQGNQYPTYLKEVNVSYIPPSTCVSKYFPASKFGKGYIDTATMTCARGVNKDSCFGDSGGPLMNQKGQQVGIVSFGYADIDGQCADNDYAGVSEGQIGIPIW